VETGDLDLDGDGAPAAAPAAAHAPGGQRAVSLRSAVDDFKRSVVERTLEESGGSWAEAARRLGMHRSNLHHLAQRLGVS
jgi:anaerobic nitric oxide reductase transcription regulator